MEEVASLLVSVPERAASTWVPALQPNNYIPQLVNHLLAALLDADSQLASPLPAQSSCSHGAADPPDGDCAAASVDTEEEAVTNKGGEASTSAHCGEDQVRLAKFGCTGRKDHLTLLPIAYHDAVRYVQRPVPPPLWHEVARSAFIGCVLSRLARRGYSRQVWLAHLAGSRCGSFSSNSVMYHMSSVKAPRRPWAVLS